MTRMSFGEPIDEDDVLVIQGVEYRMQPIGMRAMRLMLDSRAALAAKGTSTDDERGDLAIEQLDASIDLICAAVRPEERDRLRAHIDESVTPQLVAAIVSGITRGSTDVDPTLPPSSSDGSSGTGSTSTVGVPPTEASTPTV